MTKTAKGTKRIRQSQRAIIFAFKLELEAVVGSIELADAKLFRKIPTIKELLVWENLKNGDILAVSGQGKVMAAMALTLLNEKFSLKEVLMVGGAGGSKLANLPTKPGDVILANNTIEYDFISHHASTSKDPKHKYPSINYSIDLVKKYQTLLGDNLEYKLATILSADRDVIGQNERKELLDNLSPEQLSVFTWESAGFAKAARALSLSFAEIRVVVDVEEVSFKQFRELLFLHLAKLKKILDEV